MRNRRHSDSKAAEAGRAIAECQSVATVEDDLEEAIDCADRALDVFLRIPSRTPNMFVEKVRALISEYGCDGNRGTSKP